MGLTLDQELWAAQEAASLLEGEQGQRWARMIGRVRASLPRLQQDAPAIVKLISDLLPVLKQDLPAAYKSFNDALPIFEALINDWEGKVTA